MKALLKELLKEEEIAGFVSAIDAGKCPAVMSGVSPVHKAAVLACILEKTDIPVCVVCSDDGEARRFASDIRSFTGEVPAIITGREFVFYNVDVASRQNEQMRLQTLYQILHNETRIVIATTEGLLQRTLPPEILNNCAMRISASDEIAPEKLIEKLVTAGYTRADQVEGCGQFSSRGGILDFFSPAHA